MNISRPTICSFFRHEGPAPKEELRSDEAPSIPGDAFTAEELESALDPLSSKFNPSREYEQSSIGSLTPGPKTVSFVGRIVNFNVRHGRSKSHAAATGWHDLIVKDDTGAICVKLYFINKSYTLRLGLLITIWTPYVGRLTSKGDRFAAPPVPCTTSIFPGREASVHIVIHEQSGDICHTPLGHRTGMPLPNLMTIKSFLDGGSEVPAGRILVCVKSIDGTKTITTKDGNQRLLTEVAVFDDTASVALKLWGELGLSAKAWKPSETILLISHPGYRTDFRGASLGVTPSTMIEVDPEFPDVLWLRRYAGDLNKKESVDQAFPDGLWDVHDAVHGDVRPLFSIADIDNLVRSSPGQSYTGFLCLTIMDISLVLCFQRHMLLCAQCCGKPLYSNELHASCSTCNQLVPLRLNPDIIGTLLDETGCIAPGKLLWSDAAWEHLLGMPVPLLATDETATLRLIEQRVLYMRFHVLFGWAEQVGRLAVLAVMM